MSKNRNRKRKKPARILTYNNLINDYGFSRKMIDKYLPKPLSMGDAGGERTGRVWMSTDVERAMKEYPELARAKAIKEKRRKRAERVNRDVIKFLTGFSPDALIEEGRVMTRHFVLHIGPTNSGKTHDAIAALKASRSGVYLGPLRLLALEMMERMNADGCPCSLLTGEEFIDVPFAEHTASTIELCDFEKSYDIAVIDEAQMLADPYRGPHWMKAICLVDAREVHVCLAPEARLLMEKLMAELGAEYEVVEHHRLVPLEFAGVLRDVTQVEPGDALIAFSRRKVLHLAAILEKKGITSSVIYGSLPPASRREEVRRFSEKETRVVVATDAIGMGISLPIKRIIFVETEKFDGKNVRPLNRTEIRQIAGRAGRFGQYDLGEVLTMDDPERISSALRGGIRPITKVTLGFPEEALDYDFPLADMLKQWDSLPGNDLFARANMKEAELLLAALGKTPKNVTKAYLYSLITCPVDTRSEKLVDYWKECVERILEGTTPPKPYFPEETLEECEIQYHAYDIYHQLMRRVGIEDDCMPEKEALSEKINEFLKNEKGGFLGRCRICGKELPVQGRYTICDDCAAKGYTSWNFRRRGGRRPAGRAGRR